MADYVYRKIPTYSLKVRIYPNRAQKEIFSTYFLALEKAANITLYALHEHDEAICTEKEADIDQIGVEDGVKSYGRVVNLMLAWYREP